MKRLILFCGVALLTTSFQVSAQWKPAGDKIMTEWASKVSPTNVLPEYPRPQMVRSQWVNLNGEWNYAVLKKGQVEPASFDGKILVPFAIESALSGVGKTVGKDNELWYERTFTVPSAWKGKNVMLNFGAVDWIADVFINDILIGSHQGGYTPFSFDVTPYLNGSGAQKLTVRVWDPSSDGYQPRGKQVTDPEGIWYTSVTGIWQTVWLEPVTANHITAVKPVADVDNSVMNVTVSTSSQSLTDIVSVKILDKGKVVGEARGISGKELRIAVNSPKLWSPTDPYLYDLSVSLVKAGKNLDEVKSYTAFRKISTKRDANGIMRMQLNNKNIFMYGPLDQGWWPDGLYTAPTDEALASDVVRLKSFGFNMIRKHVKVEPARWYYDCDKEGILVWQDMPSGDLGNDWQPHIYNGGTDQNRSEASVADYYQEWKEIINFCSPFPCVVVWVPFNEGWGQFQTEKAVAFTRNLDPSRLINPASGGNYRPCGDILDLHNYPAPSMYLFDAARVNVLGEYGGIGYAVPDHLWWNKKNWGYIQFKSTDDVTNEYVKYAEQLKQLVARGFCAAVYTQTTDCEGEVNGLMTYDRAVIKIHPDAVRKVNQEVIHSLPE